MRTLILALLAATAAATTARGADRPPESLLSTRRVYFVDRMEGNFVDTWWWAYGPGGGTTEYTGEKAFEGSKSLHLSESKETYRTVSTGPELRATQWRASLEAPGYGISLHFYIPKAGETAFADDAIFGQFLVDAMCGKEEWASVRVASVHGAEATLRISPGDKDAGVSRGEWHSLLLLHMPGETRPVYLDGKLWTDLPARPDVITELSIGNSRAAAAAASGELYIDRFVVAGLVPGAGKPPTTYVVDQAHPAADDKNPGTAEKPLRTISRAAELSGPGDTVLIRPGIYREWVALTRTGTRWRPITFQAAKPGTVVISGADPLTDWTREPGEAPLYSTPWAHDFAISTNPDGSKVRHNAADPPLGCAEQILCAGRPLHQVMKRDDLRPGTFTVDWDRDRLIVWLPGGEDPGQVEMLGSTRSLLFSPFTRYNQWSKVDYIIVRGIVFRYAANFAEHGMVHAARGWQMEDCVVEWAGGTGLSIDGDDAGLVRVTAQHNGANGVGGQGNNLLLRDCVLRWNNRKGFAPAAVGGGLRLTGSDGARLEGTQCYENTGPGLWFDSGDTNVLVTGSTLYGNRGLTADGEGSGVLLEACPGPSRVTNNLVYSNTGAGIGIAESEKVTLVANTLVDNGTHVELRDKDARGEHRLEDVTMRQNRLKAARGAALTTGLGPWSNASPTEKILRIDADTYDQPEGRPLFRWAGKDLATLADVRRILGLEQTGADRGISVRARLVPSRAVAQLRRQGIESAVATAAEDSVVEIPVYGRTPLARGEGGWHCSVFDLNNHYLAIQVPDKLRRGLDARVPDFARFEPVTLKVRRLPAGGGVEAVLVGW